jgi:hypothetical protein
MTKCFECGKEFAETGALFCPRCGAKQTPKLGLELESVKVEIEESRHNEKMSYVLALPGLLFVGIGVWLGFAFTATKTEWDRGIRYDVTYHPYSNIAMISMGIGGLLILICLAFATFNSIKRGRLLKKQKRLIAAGRTEPKNKATTGT